VVTPDSIALRRVEQTLAPAGAAHDAVCARDAARARERPEDADRAYVAIRCADDDAARDAAFTAAHARWPANGWLAYGAAWAEAGDEHWTEALAAFEQSRQTTRAVTEQIALTEARILRFVGETDARMQPLAQRSPRLAKWLEMERPGFHADAQDGPFVATYAALAHGSVDLPAFGPDFERSDIARLTRLVAASDGASPEIVQRALALPLKDGLDGDTVWSSLGLALRSRQDPAALEHVLTDPSVVRSASVPTHLRRMWAQVVAAARPGARPLTPAELRGLDPEERGHLYAALAVALGSKAPAAYRLGANRLLFATERPFFRPPTNLGTAS
jgi:hypothetical protein